MTYGPRLPAGDSFALLLAADHKTCGIGDGWRPLLQPWPTEPVLAPLRLPYPPVTETAPHPSSLSGCEKVEVRAGVLLLSSPALFDIRLGLRGEGRTLAFVEQAWSGVRMDELRVLAPGAWARVARVWVANRVQAGFRHGPPIGVLQGYRLYGQPLSRPNG
jgi:hypothetical protein